jgi:predicted TIM-barrel fold metal-dependent hydrolase
MTGGEAFGQAFLKHPQCESPLQSPLTDDELMRRTLTIVQARNVTALTSGTPHFDPKTGKPSVAELRSLAQSGQLVAFAEISQQHEGIAANDPIMEPYYALAEELDVPIGIHMGPGPPGAAYFFAPDYRIRHSSLLLLEDVLARHPKLRLWAMHAGWPFADDAVAALYAHPQLYVDTGVIDYAFPRRQFYDYLQRLIDAGFEKRIMFGSDEMVWPDALNAAIDSVENAPSLSKEQKRDILYNNAARFLRLKP